MNQDLALLRKFYDENVFKYENALNSVNAILINIQHEMKVSQTLRNPIDSVGSRIKTFDSLVEKCVKKGIPCDDIDAVREEIKDIAGVRIVCQYLDDVYKVADLIKDSIVIQRTKDYIKNPKESGYSSLHLNTVVQISSVAEGRLMVPVEIQIRTLSMQAWAQVEHRSRYKSTNGPSPESEQMLKELACLFRKSDELAVKIRLADGEA